VACYKNYTTIAKLLLAKNVDFNIRNNEGITALSLAEGNPELKNMLKNAGAKE
jgi:ankyrin repeat protein